jgi:hypothetical protein
MLGMELKAREAKLAREQAVRKEEARRKLEAEQRQEERCVRRGRGSGAVRCCCWRRGCLSLPRECACV